MDKRKRSVLSLTVGCMLLLSTAAQRVIAWPCPPCPECYSCMPTGCECKAECGCGGKTCGGCCQCWNCSCIDTGSCSGCCNCVNCSCVGSDSTCGPPGCWDCVNCQCVECNGNPNKCCDFIAGIYICVDDCVDNAATCEWDEPPDNYVSCPNPDPKDKSCVFGVAGEVCGHRIVYRVGTAKCADCDPDCAKNRVGPCAVGYAVRCVDVPIGLFVYCLCQDEDSEPSYYSGDAYDCLN